VESREGGVASSIGGGAFAFKKPLSETLGSSTRIQLRSFMESPFTAIVENAFVT